MLLGIVVSLVEIWWHGGHSTGRCFTLKLLKVYVEIDNMRPGMAIREKQMTVG
jgi:hypothetical protein